MKFNTVIVIYNPNSTGDSKANAESFVEELKRRANGIDIRTIATKYAGHAEEIAEEHAGDESTLIVSSSGDGGYNEVVNGVLGSGGKAAVTVLPSGNANDHHTAVGPEDVIASVMNAQVHGIDVIHVRSTMHARAWSRYAHSYVGFGLTPKVGKVLTKERPNVVTEKFHVLRHTLTFKYVKLRIDGKNRRFSNLIFSTIGRMSKVIKLDETSSHKDGKMEVYETDYVSVLGILKLLFTAGTKGMTHTERTDSFTLETLRPTLVQLDGEVFTLDENSEVTVICEKAVLRTLA